MLSRLEKKRRSPQTVAGALLENRRETGVPDPSSHKTERVARASPPAKPASNP
jgi:hypothetical protein